MSERDRETQRSVLQRKLRALVDCVIVQAEKDAAFAGKLMQILMIDDPSERPANRTEGKQPESAFNPVPFLKDHGEPALVRELEGKTDDDLRATLRFQGLRKGKELKKLERAEMLREILSGAKAKLRQGLVVAQLGTAETRDQPSVDTNPKAPTPTGGRGSGMPLSDGTKRVLRFLISRWTEASDHERDAAERKAFLEPIDILNSAIERRDATHDDIRKAIVVCPPYPNFGRRTLINLADAERDGRAVTVVEREDGALKWEIESSK